MHKETRAEAREFDERKSKWSRLRSDLTKDPVAKEKRSSSFILATQAVECMHSFWMQLKLVKSRLYFTPDVWVHGGEWTY
jgi:hypothetical protein